MSEKHSVASIARGILDPLCEETSQMLTPVRLSVNDHLSITLNADGRFFILEAYAVLNGQHVMPSWNALKWVEWVPEKKELSRNRWELAATDISALIINAHWPNERITFSDEAKQVYDFLLTRFLRQTISSQQRALFKVRGQTTDIHQFVDNYVQHPERPLAKYQELALLGMMEQEGAALFMEQGTGKTPIVIARIMAEAEKHYQRTGQMYKVCICVPKNVRMNWQREVHNFATRVGKVTVVRGGQLERFKTILEAMVPDEDSEYSIIISSYETVERSWHVIGQIPWNLIVLDESHLIKWHRSKRTVRVLELRDRHQELCADLGEKTGKYFPAERIVLTGTPIANNLFDIYTQLEFLGEGMSGFTSYNTFKRFYGRFDRKPNEDPNNRQQTALTGYQHLPFLQERLARVAFMITKKEAMPDLPEKLSMILETAMTPKQRELYMKLQEHLALQIQDAEANSQNKQMLVNNILTMLLRLAQITSGFFSWDPIIDAEGNMLQPRQIEYIDPNPKLDLLIDTIKASGPKSKFIVWSCFVPDIKKISERLTQEGIKHVQYYGGVKDDLRVGVEDAFNCDPDVKVLVGNQGAGGTGLNLRGYNPDWVGTPKDHGCNCDNVVYYAQDWSMIKRAQSEDRAHRRGTRVNVNIIDLVIPGTIDEEIRTRVTLKQVTALQIQDVRDIMSRILETVPSDIDE